MIVGPPAPSDTMPDTKEHLGQIARHARAMGRAIESIDPNNQGPQGPPGVDGTNGTNGTDGTAATIAVGTVGSTTNAGTTSIVNSGTSATATFDFVLRDGPSGTNGTDGTDGTDGTAATIAVGTVGSTTNAGTAAITNSGTSGAATFDFILKDGPQGTAGNNGNNGTSATIAVGTVGSTSNAGTASITNSGTNLAATFDFVLRDGPQGTAGINGNNGSAATVSVGTTGSVPNTGTASVVNSGSSSAATLDFVLRDGAPGANGADGIMSSITQGGGIIVTDPAGTSPTVAVNPALIVDSLALENGESIVNSVNNQISIRALSVTAGTGLSNALFSSLGAHNLSIGTGGGISPLVQLEDGANGNINITNNGTGRLRTEDISIQGASRYLNFAGGAGSSGYGLRDLSGEIEVKDSTGDWGQPYHSGMASGSSSFFEGSTSFNARGSTFTFAHGLSVAAQGCPRVIQAYIKRVAAGTVRGIPQYDWVTIDTGTDYENFNSGLTIRGNASSIHVDIGVMNRGITIIAPDNFQEYIVPIDGSFDIIVRAWL